MILQFMLFITSANSKHLTIQPRITKGYNCSIAEYSHLVAIAFDEHQFCGGSLIRNSWVLTAAHCCKTIWKLESFTVIFGSRIWMQDIEMKTSIQQVFMHDNYSSRPWHSDFCLLKLKTDIVTSEKVKITKLATPEEYSEMIQKKKCEQAIVMGFGDQRRSLVRFHEDYNPHVQCVKVKVIDQKDCNDAFKDKITDTIFCAIDPEGKGADVCKGDSGGPILCHGLQIGVVAAGIGCGKINNSGLYNRVDIYSDFIKESIAEEEGFNNYTISPSAPTFIADCREFLWISFLLYLNIITFIL